jgi:GT2 family glycosyltransferase
VSHPSKSRARLESPRLSDHVPRALVSALMPCFRDFHLVERSLPRILEGSGCDLEVVVLNNDSDQVEQMRGLVGGLSDPRLRLVELEHRAGFIEAINAGIAATTGELVFFANSDLFVAEGYLDAMVSFFERHTRAGCAIGKILRYDLKADRETDIIDTTGHVIGRNRRVVDRGENQRDVGQYEREEEVFGGSGAALVARREALEAVKVHGEYLDKTFHMYKDDIDLCWRLRLAGWECWYVPTAKAHHGRTSKGLGRHSYLSDMRRFHENEQTKPAYVRMNSMKNHWLTLVKNDDLTNLVRDLPHILGREALILGYNLVSAPRDTVITLRQFSRALPRALAKRREIKMRQCISASEIRSWFVSESHSS